VCIRKQLLWAEDPAFVRSCRLLGRRSHFVIVMDFGKLYRIVSTIAGSFGLLFHTIYPFAYLLDILEFF
jgi:hypothetical protein